MHSCQPEPLGTRIGSLGIATVCELNVTMSLPLAPMSTAGIWGPFSIHKAANA
jgi:hypothetical protein